MAERQGARLLQELAREEVRALAPEALAVVPVGATEQHGPHLPTGTDHFAVEWVARDAAAWAARAIPLVVAPTLPFGSSHHLLPFGSTMSLGTEAYYRVLRNLLGSLIAGGFRRLFVVNGHGGNQELIQLAARDLARERPAHIAAASYWTIAWDELVAAGATGPGKLPGHADAFESSLVLALRPELVREPRPHRDDEPGGDARPVARYRAESHGSWQAMDGYTNSPARATAEQGRACRGVEPGAVAQAFVEFYQATGGEG